MPAFFSALVALSTISAALAKSGHSISVVNNCPGEISLFQSGAPQGYLKHGQGKNLNVPENWSGFIYSSANGGSQSGHGATRAGFYFPNNEYYILRDSSYFNTGVSIIPVQANGGSGNCAKVTCNSPGCGNNAYTSPPTGFSATPSAPLFQCNKPDWDYLVEFCPTGSFPQGVPRSAVVHHPAGRRDAGGAIHPGWDAAKCLAVQGNFVNGSPVVIEDCNGSASQQFAFNDGNTHIRVASSEFCLTSDSASLWFCNSADESQNWILTNNNRFQSAQNNALCLDNANGSMDDGNRVQVAGCHPNEGEQVWTF